MRAAFISPIMPDETGNGLAMRMGMFAEALATIAELHVIVVPVAAGPTTASPLLKRLGAKVDVVSVRGRRDARFELIASMRDPQTKLDAFRHYGRPSMSAFLSPQVVTEIGRLLQTMSPDLLHVGRACLAPVKALAPPVPRATLDLDEADLPSLLSQAKVAREAGNEWRACWLEQEGKACDRLIVEHGVEFARMFVASRREAKLLTTSHPQFAFDVIENAVEIPLSVKREDDGCTLLFVGSLGFEPNVHAIVAFCRSALPLVSTARDNGGALRLLIAGANPPASVEALSEDPRIEVLGFVADLAALYRMATLTIAPLSAGGGTRIKLIESAAHGVASISTPVGSEGLEWPEGVGGWVAEMAEPFVQACLDALNVPAERHHRATLGLDFVGRHHNRRELIRRIASIMLTFD
jgi:polysaccharide biosynthesis protein PslH